MGTTRVRHNHSQEVQAAIIAALRDNVGDYFTSAEIAETIGNDEFNTQHVASILKVMLRDGLAKKSHERGANLYTLTPEALDWKPAPYDWRVSKGIGQTTAQSVTPPVTQDTPMFIPVPPPPGIPALSIDTPPLSSARLAMALDILGTDPPPVPVSHDDERSPPRVVTVSDKELMPVETKKECRCTRVAKLPPLPKGYAYIGIKLFIEDESAHIAALSDHTEITIQTIDEGAGAFLSWKIHGALLTNRGEMAELAAIGDALLALHDESNRHE